MSGSNPGIAVEWIEGKRHYLIRRAGTKWAYSRSHGDGRRWDIFDGGFAKLLEIPAKTNEEALAQVSAMALDGSLEGLINDRRQSQMSSQGSVLRNMAAWADYGRCKAERDAELFPKPNSDGAVRPSIIMKRETHRLLRAVALKRAKLPGEQPSIGAVVEEVVERYRVDLEREAGATYKRELAKKR